MLFAVPATVLAVQLPQTAIPSANQPAPAASTPYRAVAPPPKPVPEPSPRKRAEAEKLYLDGARKLEASSFASAEKDFARASELDPAHTEYVAAVLLAREHRVTRLLQESIQTRALDPTASSRLLKQAEALSPENPRVQQETASAALRSSQDSAEPTRVRRVKLAGTIHLQPRPGRQSFHTRANSLTLASMVGTAFGVRVVGDTDLHSVDARLDLDAVDFADAMEALRFATGTMFVPLDEHTLLLADDTAANRARLERLTEETIELPGYTVEQINDLANVAKQIFDMKQVSVSQSLGKMTLRAPADVMESLNHVFDDLLDRSADVVFNIKLYAVSKDHVRNLGVVLPQQVNAFSLAAEAQTIVSQNQALIQQLIASGLIPSTASTTTIAEYLVLVAGLGSSSLLSNSFLLLGGGLTTAALSLGGSNAAINLALTQSEARELEDTELRCADHGSATMKNGTRYPIQTSIYTDIASPTAAGGLAGISVNGVSLSGLLSQYLGTNGSLTGSGVVPQVEYEDLGLTVKAEPRIQPSGDVKVHIELTLTSLAGQSLNGIPVLTNRQFTNDMTVRDGETALMVSYANESELRAASGIPGLSELPGFQAPTNVNAEKTTGDLVVLITPHIVRFGHRGQVGPQVPLPTRPDQD